MLVEQIPVDLLKERKSAKAGTERGGQGNPSAGSRDAK